MIKFRFIIALVLAAILVAGISTGTCAAPTNLAIGATASAECSWSGYPASNLNDGNQGTIWLRLGGGHALSNYGHWVELDWSSNQTFNTVVLYNSGGQPSDWGPLVNYNHPFTMQAWNETTSTWDSISTIFVPSATNIQPTLWFHFPTQTTNKIRIDSCIIVKELEVYNYTTGVKGQLSSTAPAGPVTGGVVSSNGLTTVTDCSGNYFLPLTAGSYTIIGNGRMETTSGSATVVDGAIATRNLQILGGNVIKYGTVTASSETLPASPASSISDDLLCDMWASNTSAATSSFVVDFGSTPRSFKSVFVMGRDNNGYNSAPSSYQYPLYVKLEAWNSSLGAYQLVGQIGTSTDVYGVPAKSPYQVVNLSSAVTTTKLKVTGLQTIAELEAYPSTTVSGRVTNGVIPVGCATVVCSGQIVHTDSLGNYSFALSSGNYSLTVSADTYNDFTQAFTVGSVSVSLPDIVLTRTPGNLVMNGDVAMVDASSYLSGYEPAMAVDGIPCSKWDSGNAYGGTWLTIDWNNPVTIDTIKIDNGSGYPIIDVWENNSWVMIGGAPSAIPTTMVFGAPKLTSRLRIRNCQSINDIGVFNRNGAAPIPNVTGTVTNSLNGAPVVKASVRIAENIFAYTNGDGVYSAYVPSANNVEIWATKSLYDNYLGSVDVPSTGTIVKNIVMQTGNLARSASSVEASSFWNPPIGVFEAEFGNDDDTSTRWCKLSAEQGADAWYQFNWDSPITTNKVMLLGSSSWYEFFEVQYWNGSEWVVAYHDGNPSGDNPVLLFAPVTTTKLRIRGAHSFFEAYIYQAPPIQTGTIGTLRNLPEGTPVHVTGSVTAVFKGDRAYVEALDRSSAISVIPWDRFGSVAGGDVNLALDTNGGVAEAGGPSPLPHEWPGFYWAGCANDGDFWESFWCGGQIDNKDTPEVEGIPESELWHEWLSIKWPNAQTFNKVVVKHFDWLNNDPSSNQYLKYRNFGLEIWNDSTNVWVPLMTVNNGENATFEFDFPSVTSKGFRLRDVRSIREVEAYNEDVTLFTNKEVGFNGVVTTINGEPAILAGAVTFGSDFVQKPLGMTNKSLSTGSGQLSTSSLLVTVWGTVKAKVVANNGWSYLYVDDGSGAASDIPGITGVKIGPLLTDIGTDAVVKATGIAGNTTDGVRTIRTRSTQDVEAIF